VLILFVGYCDWVGSGTNYERVAIWSLWTEELCQFWIGMYPLTSSIHKSDTWTIGWLIFARWFPSWCSQSSAQVWSETTEESECLDSQLLCACQDWHNACVLQLPDGSSCVAYGQYKFPSCFISQVCRLVHYGPCCRAACPCVCPSGRVLSLSTISDRS